jgi:hypothetical protein
LLVVSLCGSLFIFKPEYDFFSREHRVSEINVQGTKQWVVKPRPMGVSAVISAEEAGFAEVGALWHITLIERLPKHNKWEVMRLYSLILHLILPGWLVLVIC